MAERKGSALRRLLSSADRLSEAAISFGSLSVNTPVSRSSARECSVTACDQRWRDGFAFAMSALRVGPLKARRQQLQDERGAEAPGAVEEKTHGEARPQRGDRLALDQRHDGEGDER